MTLSALVFRAFAAVFCSLCTLVAVPDLAHGGLAPENAQRDSRSGAVVVAVSMFTYDAPLNMCRESKLMQPLSLAASVAHSRARPAISPTVLDLKATGGDTASAMQAPEHGTFYADPNGNVVPTPPGGGATSSPDGRFVQARDAAGNPTGVRIDGPHKPASHPDPRAQQPHGHVPGVRNPDGTPWLPINR